MRRNVWPINLLAYPRNITNRVCATVHGPSRFFDTSRRRVASFLSSFFSFSLALSPDVHGPLASLEKFEPDRFIGRSSRRSLSPFFFSPSPFAFLLHSLSQVALGRFNAMPAKRETRYRGTASMCRVPLTAE